MTTNHEQDSVQRGFNKPLTRITLFLPVQTKEEEKAIRAVIRYLEGQRINSRAAVKGFTHSQYPDALLRLLVG